MVQLLRGQAAIQVMCAAADAVAEIGLIPARGISMYQSVSVKNSGLDPMQQEILVILVMF